MFLDGNAVNVLTELVSWGMLDMLDSKKTDLNWPGLDSLFGYTGLGYDYSSGLTYARARYYQAVY